MRLIDADWVLDHTKPYELSDEYWSVTGGTAIRLICNAVNQAPTIDAVPVVRCKDCIRRYDTDECQMCFLIEGKYYEYTNGNGYCDRGERKEGAE
jgi:hypothetical protein